MELGESSVCITNGVHPRTPSVILSDREAQQSGRSAADSEGARDAERTVKLAMTAFGGWNVELDRGSPDDRVAIGVDFLWWRLTKSSPLDQSAYVARRDGFRRAERR